MVNSKNEYTRRAVAIMTAWAAEPDGGDFAMDTLMEIVREQGRGDDLKGASDVLIGMINLCGQLLIHVEAETGVRDIDTLKAVAAQIA